MTKNDTPQDLKRPNLRGIPQNKTTLFMLPALNLSSEKTGYKLLRYFGFVNCYLDHVGTNGEYPNCLYLVFNPNSEALKKFKDFYAIYRSYPNYVEDYIVDAHLIVVVFKVKEQWKSSLEEFKKSRYSRMSKEYAEMFKRPLMTGNVQISDEYYIIHKSKDYKTFLEDKLSIVHTMKDGSVYKDIVVIDENAELMSPLDLEQEIFNYEPIT